MSLVHLLPLLKKSADFKTLMADLASNTPVGLTGLSGSGKAFLAAGLGSDRTCLFIVPTSAEAEALADDISAFNPSTFLYPDWEILPYESASPHLDLVAERMTALTALLEERKGIVVTHPRALMQKTIPADFLMEATIHLSKGQEVDRENLIRGLVEAGYTRQDMVEQRGDMSVRGGIIDIFPPQYLQTQNQDLPVRIDFFGDCIEEIRGFDPQTQRSTAHLKEITILPVREAILSEPILEQAEKIGLMPPFTGIEQYLPLLYPESSTILDYLPQKGLLILDEPSAFKEEVKKIEDEVRARYSQAQTDNQSEIDNPQSAIRNPEPARMISHLPDILEKAAQYPSIHFSILGDDLNERKRLDWKVQPITTKPGGAKQAFEEVRAWCSQGYQVIVVVGFEGQGERLREILEEMELPRVPIATARLRVGFLFPEIKVALITEHEIFGYPQARRKRRFISEESAPLESISELTQGNYCVHVNYGIGRYLGIDNLVAAGYKRDFLTIEYAEGDKLYVPFDQLNLVQKYIGSEENPPPIYRMGGRAWDQVKLKVKRSIQNMAKELLELYAARSGLPGYNFSQDTPWQREFEAGFIYEETPDQLKVIEEVKRDMEKGRPMDRLVCGDVGYGKTEVAIRAAFKTVMESKQVAVLVPTTILAEQHFATFKERFKNYPVSVDVLSRFKTKREQTEIVAKLSRGELDVVIGTHRLLQKDIEFREIGLIIVDEEQRFGVRHKERLKALRRTVDCLTLTATPIPRTLYMSLMGTRDISIINTPPLNRLPIKTHVGAFKPELVREAILREMDRGGQIYFVHNRVETIDAFANHLADIVPETRMAIAHGQMRERELERVMLDFLDHKFDLLLSTTIIESGLDISSVNTIIIHQAHRFGLAQLYQLRGRVGRAKHQAYAYLFYPSKLTLSGVARKRLAIIKDFTDLGSGLRIAMQDLEIRGSGNILGPQQHGEMMTVGFDLYCQMLKQTIAELKGEPVEEELPLPTVDLPGDAYIPDDYIPDPKQRFSIYKRIARAKTRDDLKGTKEELTDRFGRIPEVANRLLEVMHLRISAKEAGVLKVGKGDGVINIRFTNPKQVAPKILEVLKVYPRSLRLNPEQPDTVTITDRDGIAVLKKVLQLMTK
ncbi:MAG: transcription-repair coupling factor [bacterium]|nr:transcription-repair coupling factor [bacterium]